MQPGKGIPEKEHLPAGGVTSTKASEKVGGQLRTAAPPAAVQRALPERGERVLTQHPGSSMVPQAGSRGQELTLVEWAFLASRGGAWGPLTFYFPPCRSKRKVTFLRPGHSEARASQAEMPRKCPLSPSGGRGFERLPGLICQGPWGWSQGKEGLWY